MQIRFNVLPTLIVVAASLGCTTSVKQYGIGFSDPNDPDIIYFDSIRNAQDRLSLLSTLDRAVPNGTPISRAEKLMADAGFQCKHYSSASFNETADSSGIDGRYRFVDHADYLLCSLPTESSASQEHSWTIALLYDGRRRVCDILVRSDGHQYLSKQAEPSDAPQPRNEAF
ncbi:hypothetical protein [Stieleria varia]|uniref:Lipoprotein n=1 Tax=Stieleria varia TaxID=2528005 RepID=A0A5C5ZKL0_9BACT|nr:hypothetical protein [Stieleria varia]TWT86963.1 hypothetical protein Pla52n_70710 [Stieleria varia]